MLLRLVLHLMEGTSLVLVFFSAGLPVSSGCLHPSLTPMDPLLATYVFKAEAMILLYIMPWIPTTTGGFLWVAFLLVPTLLLVGDFVTTGSVYTLIMFTIVSGQSTGTASGVLEILGASVLCPNVSRQGRVL